MSEETNALSIVDMSTAALAAFGVDSDEPIRPSNLALLQPIQVADEPGLVAGRFRDSQSNVQYETLNVVPLLMTPGRVCFPPGGDLGAKPICRSRDGLLPVLDNPDLVRQDGGLGCKKCPKSQWKKINGKNIKSECAETVTFLIAELETQFVFRYNVKGTALPPVRDLKDTIKKEIQRARFKGVFLPPYGMTFQMSSVKIKGKSGTYFIPKFLPTGLVHPDDLSAFAKLANHFSSRGVVEEAPEEMEPVSKVLDGEYVESAGGYEAA